MLLAASRDHGIILSDSYIIGDKESDVLAGKAAGLAGTILLRSPAEPVPNDTVADLVTHEFGTAIEWLERREQPS